MRKIKFRGFNKKNNKWLHGFYLQNRGAHFVCPDEFANGKSWEDYEVAPETVGQFIGMTDMYNREIYEGDIVYSEFGDGSNSNCLVGWNEMLCCFGIMDEYQYRSKLEGYDFPEFSNDVLINFHTHSKRFEVIGNIHENKEILQEDKREC